MKDNIDWKNVEEKIAIICYKFRNLSSWQEDLAQELRIHAYYVSDNYYDLYRKAIDFWRKIQTRQAPEIPYFDLEVLNPTSEDKSSLDEFDELVFLIRKELSRPGENKWDEKYSEIANTLLDFIVSDIDYRKKCNLPTSSVSSMYINRRLNLSWAAEETGIGYKRLVNAMKLIEDIVAGLHMMHKIDIPSYYLEDYYNR